MSSRRYFEKDFTAWKPNNLRVNLRYIMAMLKLEHDQSTSLTSIEMVCQVHVAHMPPELRVYAAYYSELENAAYLRDQLLAGNTDFEYAFIDASMVVSSRQVLAATFRAMN